MAEDVIELLETYLAWARKHPFDHVAVSMVHRDDPNVACADYAGNMRLEVSQLETLGILRQRLHYSITHWQLPKRDETLDASYVVYNLAHDPLCFDFVVWLVDAEMTRIREGAPGPLKVGFWKGSNPDETMARDNRVQWLTNVFRPALEMIGAVEDERAVYGRHKDLFVPKDIVKASHAGEQVPQFRTDRKSKYPGYVTLTLREADHWPERNSDMDAWVRFAAYLEDHGERVVFIRDTAKANEPIQGFETWPEAATDLHLRMAAYQEAKANVMISNGPVGLCLFSKAAWLQFVPLEVENSSYTPNTAKFWQDNNGVPVGRQYPWAGADQRIVWSKDSFTSLVFAWKSYAPSLEGRHAA